MSTYAIGDVQGCYTTLIDLLALIKFNPAQDQLWFAGDLINRGPDSLTTLRFIKNLGTAARLVLGNHDLHFLAACYQAAPTRPKDTFQSLLAATDSIELADWLRQQPLLIYDAEKNYCMTHAGIPHLWNLEQAQTYAQEVEAVLRNPKLYPDFLTQMYDKQPDCWDENLPPMARYRIITHYFTRMRYIRPNGQLDFKNKDAPISLTIPQSDYLPWFSYPSLAQQQTRIIFGHWATLMGHTQSNRIFGLDTGCVWGERLTALRLEDEKIFSCSAQ